MVRVFDSDVFWTFFSGGVLGMFYREAVSGKI